LVSGVAAVRAVRGQTVGAEGQGEGAGQTELKQAGAGQETVGQAVSHLARQDLGPVHLRFERRRQDEEVIVRQTRKHLRPGVGVLVPGRQRRGRATCRIEAAEVGRGEGGHRGVGEGQDGLVAVAAAVAVDLKQGAGAVLD
jgi:hypothetical protein